MWEKGPQKFLKYLEQASKSIRGSIGKGVVYKGSGTGLERSTRGTSERGAGGFFFYIFFLFLFFVNFSVALFSVLTFCFTLLVSQAFDLGTHGI